MIILWCLKLYSFAMRYLPFFIKKIVTLIRMHPTFMALKNSLKSLFLVAKRLNELYNPMIESGESDLLTDSKQDGFFIDSVEDGVSTESEAKNDSFLRDALLVTCLVSFAIVVIRCIWNNRSSENKCLEEIQVEKRKAFIKDDCSRLKELHKVLLCLKHNIKVLPENRKTSPFITHPITEAVREMTNRSLYSNVSRKQVTGINFDREENFEKLRENLQKAIFMVEEQLDYQSNIVDDTELDDYKDAEFSTEAFDDVCYLPKQPMGDSESVTADPGYHIDLRRLQKIPNLNPTQFLFEKQMDVKSLVTDAADKPKPTEPCKECSKMKEALLFLKRQLDNAPFRSNILTECNGVDARLKCPKSNETQNSVVLNVPPSAQQTCDCKNLKKNIKQAMADAERNILNVNATKNTLNIEILFNRNIQLDQVTKES